MMRFRRKTTEQPAGPAVSAPSEGAAPIDRAQALLALLGEDARKIGLGGTTAGSAEIPQDRLRLLARDLIAQVEGQRAAQPGSKAPAPPVARAEPSPIDEGIGRRQLFSSPSPLSRRAAQPEADRASPAAPPAAPEPRIQAVVARPETMPTPMAQPRPAAPAARMLSADEVRRLVHEGYDPALSGAEHPAIVALTLEGKPPLQQAAALRELPRGQVRAVHRALRLLEAHAV